MIRLSFLAAVFIVCAFAVPVATAQQPPSIGYMFPLGGQAGQTIEVTLGGYDWTPDMQIFTLDPRVKLEIISALGPVIVPEPPYWFGKKARRGPFPMPRETRARLTIPAEVAPGLMKWQAANVNGATATGRFLIGVEPEVVEVSDRTQPQMLTQLPVTVSGQIKKIEEVDRYQVKLARSGPVTCAVVARALGSELNAVLQVHDDTGRLVCDAADTAGSDTALTFHAEANRVYTIGLYDVDFRGNRAFVYRLSVTPGPRVIAASPAAGQRGATQLVELFGYGIATGAPQLESTTREIAFPADPTSKLFLYTLETPYGNAPAFAFPMSDIPETTEATLTSRQLVVPTALTGSLDEKYGEDRYRISGKMGDIFEVVLNAEKTGSPLDVSLAILDADGKELLRGDDLPGSTDAAIEFAVPADGEYQISVTDDSGQSGARSSIYRLTLEAARPDFSLAAAELLAAPLGGKVSLPLTVKRIAGFKGPISILLAGLPAGVTASAELIIPEGQSALNIELNVDAAAAAIASLVTITGEAQIGEQKILHSTDPLLMAITIKPPFAVDAEGKDDVTKWPRGSTFPAPALIERDEGFNGPIVLEMAARQDRHRQGISGPELTVPPGVNRVLYPIYLPEWLETTRTSRMVVNGVAKVTDPQGNVRYSLTRQKTRMGFLPTGALLKLSADVSEFDIQSDQAFEVPLSISRSPSLVENVRIELIAPDDQQHQFTAEPLTLDAARTQASLQIDVRSTDTSESHHDLTIRSTVLQSGDLPVISETRIHVYLSANIGAQSAKSNSE